MLAKSLEDMCVTCQKKRRRRESESEALPLGFCEPLEGSIPTENGVVPVETEDEAQSLFVDAFLHNNRLEHMVQVMGYHPQYLDCFLKAQHYMLRGDGPLSYEYRHYIAIMAAARHQCSYLVDIQTTEFLLAGGDERWLKGLEHIPKKLRDLSEVNKVLCHRPWLINKSHIEKLTRGNDNWSLSEVMHAIVLLAHFHALSSFVYGCGISVEIDQDGGHTFRPPSLSTSEHNSLDSTGHSPNSHHGTPNSASDVEGGIEVLMETMRKLREEGREEEASEEEKLKRFEKVESQSAELPAAATKPSPKADLLRYVEDANFTYEDFANRGTTSKLPTFRAQDYSWEEQGFSLCNRLYPEMGSLLDDKFSVTYNLTYNTMGNCNDVDTTSFRTSIWNYIHCMFGIRHDDYDYSEVNQLLERSLKAYVKTVTCFPERISKKDYDSFMREFRHSEKVHVNLMLLEARLQAELLYALRAIMRYMT
jgi:sestrin